MPLRREPRRRRRHRQGRPGSKLFIDEVVVLCGNASHISALVAQDRSTTDRQQVPRECGWLTEAGPSISNQACPDV
jgi:hypothetical protein